jgi:putative ABC transport system permease protein
MLKISLTALWAHKRRLLGTFLAVFLGVSFLSGTFVLSDTLRASIGDMFVEANEGTDTIVRSATDVSDDPNSTRGPIDARLVDRIRGIDGVAAAAPVIQGFGQPVGKDGDTIEVRGPRTAGNWISDQELNPYRIVEGRPPRADDEVVLNRGAAKEGDLHVGDRTAVLAPNRVPVRIVGIATFGDSDGFGGSSFTGFTLPAAQRLIARAPGKVMSISVRAQDGVSADDLTQRIRSALPPGVQALSGTQVTDENRSDLEGAFLSIFQAFLTVFAGVALLVAAFSIHNTFSIIVAQRTRESALLRAVGASRGQILSSVGLEALAIGLAASAAGIIGGLGIAALLKAAFAGVGMDLPARGLVFEPATIAVALPVGVLVTVLAGIVPAVKASRVPPIAALRDVALDRPSRRGRLTSAAVSFIGAPVARWRGISGGLARRNAMRNPRRTRAAAMALLVGVGVVTVITVFAASLRTSIEGTVSDSFAGDLAISSGGFGQAGFTADLAHDVGRLPQVAGAAGIGLGTARVDGGNHEVSVGDPAALARVLTFDVGTGALAVSEDVADDKGWRVGTTVPVRFADGALERLRIGAVYPDGDVVGDYLVSRAEWSRHADQAVDNTVLVKLDAGADPGAAKAALERAAEPFGSPDVQTRQEFIDSRTQMIGTALTLVYVMLALAVVIALMGIANTLSLSTYERTRELGLLRAVGQTRRQLRAMVRWESFIVAAFGSAFGTALGLLGGWALAQAVIGDAAVPAQVVVVLIVGALVGILAGVRPARRAARLDVLRAIAAE